MELLSAETSFLLRFGRVNAIHDRAMRARRIGIRHAALRATAFFAAGAFAARGSNSKLTLPSFLS